MSKLSKSPGRNTFQRENYIKRKLEAGEPPSKEYLEMFDVWDERNAKCEADPEWAKSNLEYDLRSTDWILEKVRNSDVYAQNLYAAICNNTFQNLEMWEILTDRSWSCSWRYAGGIIADMQEKGDYIDWYCSGIRNNPTPEEYASMTDQEKEIVNRFRDHVGEGTVTDQIREDLRRLGWIVL